MTPTKLTLKGAIGILSGLNRDELSIDLTEIVPDDAITVALRGDNGSGKSTLFNLAFTPWREPPMLSATLYDEFQDDGLMELEFTHAGHLYRSHVEIKKTRKTKSQRAYLHHRDDAGDWHVVTLPDNTVSDGRTRTYDACLEHVLGSESLYYLSAFRAQGAPKLAEYDDPKGLMRDLLALNEIHALREQAIAVIKELRRNYEHSRGDYDRLEEKTTAMDDLTIRISTMENELPGVIRAKVEASEAAAMARANFESAATADSENAKVRQLREAVENRIADRALQGHDAIEQAQSDAAKVKNRARQARADANVRFGQIRQRIESAQQIIERRDEIDQATADAEILTGQIHERETAIGKLREQANKITELTGEMRTLLAQQDHNVDDGKSLAARYTDLQQRAGYVDEVPCGGAAPFDSCPALKDALQATELFPDVETDIQQKRVEWHALNKQITAKKGEIEQLSAGATALDVQEESLAGATALDVQEESLAGIKLRFNSLRQTAASLASCIKQAEQSLTAAQTELETTSAADSERTQTIESEIAELIDRAAKIRTETDAAVKPIEAELSALPNPDPSGMLTSAKNGLEASEIALTSAAAAVDQKNAELAESRAMSGTLRSELDAGESIRRKAKILENEIAQWSLLSLALKGVIDLSIEDAGPAISNTANKLLTEAYGPRFTTKIITQREQANGRLVECFDISVIDAESGLESSILQKSGGESVWLDKALTDSVGIYHQDASGVHYECLFADESEDGLTQDRKAQFYRMDRAALKLGGYERKFFVSHDPEAWSMADAVIDLDEWRVG